MALTNEEIKELKSQLLQQIQHLSPDKKEEAMKQIDEMSPESLEVMLNQQHSKSQKIFRMIINNEIPSVKIAENEKAIAVLSTKSISKGHTLIVPKSPASSEAEIPKEAHSLAEQTSKKIMGSLKAQKTEIIPEKNFGEVILNVLPIYEKTLNLSSKREDFSVEELEKIKLEINIEKIEKEPEKIKIKKARKKKPVKLKRRIP